MLLKIYGYETTNLLGKFYMQENNAPFVTKNVNFLFLPWTLLGHSKKTLTEAELLVWFNFPHFNKAGGYEYFSREKNPINLFHEPDIPHKDLHITDNLVQVSQVITLFVLIYGKMLSFSFWKLLDYSFW